MSEKKDIRHHNMNAEKGKTSLTRRTGKSRKERKHTEPTGNELMFTAWQKIYENRHNRLI